MLCKFNVKDATTIFLFPIEGERITEKEADKRVKTSVAYLALCEGGCEIFGKKHSNKMIKFLLIEYFHGTSSYESIFLFLNSVSNM